MPVGLIEIFEWIVQVVINEKDRTISNTDFTLQSLNDDSPRKELNSNRKKPRNLSLQLCYRRFLCPKVVNVIVELLAHRHLVRSRVDIP